MFNFTSCIHEPGRWPVVPTHSYTKKCTNQIWRRWPQGLLKRGVERCGVKSLAKATKTENMLKKPPVLWSLFKAPLLCKLHFGRVFPAIIRPVSEPEEMKDFLLLSPRVLLGPAILDVSPLWCHKGNWYHPAPSKHLFFFFYSNQNSSV